MGNHASVVFYVPGGTQPDDISPTVYLHWNGGPESVYAFLDEMDRRKVRTGDPAYESARFCHIVGDFFDANGVKSDSLGLLHPPATIDVAGTYDIADFDNGAYVVYRNHLKRLVRRFIGGKELTPRQVGDERRKAYKETNLDKDRGIPAWFKLARPFLFGEENKFTEEAFGVAVAVWNGGEVGKVAQNIYWSCEWENLPMLADAIEEASSGKYAWLVKKLRTPEICGSREDFVRLLTWGAS